MYYCVGFVDCLSILVCHCKCLWIIVEIGTLNQFIYYFIIYLYTKSTPRAVPQKKVFFINFHLAGNFFKINSWLEKYKEYLMKTIQFMSIKFQIVLYSCGKLCLYNNKKKRFHIKLSAIVFLKPSSFLKTHGSIKRFNNIHNYFINMSYLFPSFIFVIHKLYLF